MLPYWCLIFIVFLLQYKLVRKIPKQYNFFFLIVLLFLFAAFRGNGEGDYFNYLKYATYITTMNDVLNFSFPMEIGFRCLAYLVNLSNMHPQVVIAAMNAISLFCIYKLINHYSPDKCFSIIIFIPIYLQFDMHAARTAVAISLCSMAFHYLLENNNVKYAVFVLLAMCFHQTSIVFFVVYFMNKLHFGLKLSILILLLVILVSFTLNVDQIIVGLLRVLNLQSYANAYVSYATSAKFGYALSVFDPRVFMAIGIYLYFKFLVRTPNNMENLIANIMLLNIILLLILHQHSSIALRLTAFFNIYSVLAIPIASTKLKNMHDKNAIKLIISGLYFAYLAVLLSDYVPYIICTFE